MRKQFVVAVLTPALLPWFTPAEAQQPQRPPEGVQQICMVSSIPGGWVVVGRTTTEQCRANADLPEKENTWLIKRPAAKEIVCERSPYPGDFAVTARVRSNSCLPTGDENTNNAWLIEKIK